MTACEDDSSSTITPGADGRGSFDVPSDGGGSTDTTSDGGGEPVPNVRRRPVAAPATARLAYVTLEGGGGGVNDDDDAALEVSGDGTLPADPLLFVDHVTVKGSRGVGVAVHGLATFAPDSHDLLVTASGGEKYPYALSIEEHSIDYRRAWVDVDAHATDVPPPSPHP